MNQLKTTKSSYLSSYLLYLSCHFSYCLKWMEEKFTRWILFLLSLFGKSNERMHLNHLAIIMDGNRRYAKRLGISSELGHSYGFEALRRMLNICVDANIHYLTVFAFSLDNFKRSQREVDCLMELACEKFNEFCESKNSVQKYRVRVRVLGELSLLPEKVKLAAIKVMEMTKDNDCYFLNICMPYGSMHEMKSALHSFQQQRKEIEKVDDVSFDRFSDFLYTRDLPCVDALLRTSGESRLSDFLLWQIASYEYTLCYFEKILWPDFNTWHMILLYVRFLYDRLLMIQK